jgi:hypothetical protein
MTTPTPPAAATCAQPVINQSEYTIGVRPCGRAASDPIHPGGAHLFEGGQIGAQIKHAFVEPAPALPDPPADRAAAREEATVFAWLIERTDNGTYWDGRGIESWHPANEWAVRFARKEDAERVIYWLLANEPVVAREHGWFDGGTR